ncbi:MAG: outer membrane lipoprotein carrier protein LolA [bacterium]
MTRPTTNVLALAALLTVSTAASSPNSAKQADLLDRAVVAWAKVKTARATFEQTITNPLTGRTMTALGEYQQERPGKLAVTFADPADDRIVADGKFVWLYLPSSAPDQVIKSVQGAGGTGTVDISAQFLTAPRSKYTVNPVGTLVVSGRPTHGYNLIPKVAAGAQFKNASVWIDDDDATIRQFEVSEANGVQRRIRLTSFKTNVPVDANAFVFTLPKGVRVVEQ